jgi:competence ComEA-like helix-hairpin-helix protein
VEALTPAERRGALAVALLLALGAGHDLWRASRPVPSGAAPGREGSAAIAGAEREPDERGRGGTGAGGAGPVEGLGPVLDLNRASARELESLPGVGPVLAGRIVAHRERHGPFSHPEELLAVRGIGPRLFERLRPRVRTGAGGAPAPPPAATAPGRSRDDPAPP